MNIPTYVVIDTDDGFTFTRDRYGQLFDEEGATRFADLRNHGLKEEKQTYIVATVTPVMSPQLMAAAVKAQQTRPQLEAYSRFHTLSAILHQVREDGTFETRDQLVRRALEYAKGATPPISYREMDEAAEVVWDKWSEESHRFYSWDQSDGTRADND